MIKTLVVTGYKPKSKARPRFTKTGKVHMPADYKEWQRAIGILLFEQWTEPPVRTQHLVIFFDVLDMRNDADNLGGATMDVMVSANKTLGRNILENDNLNCVPNLCVFTRKIRANPKIYITLIYNDSNPHFQLMIYLIKMFFGNPISALTSLLDYFKK